ncbi:MAG: hypothetical protein ACR2M7_01305 [Bdellovibrionales bacterium]
MDKSATLKKDISMDQAHQKLSPKDSKISFLKIQNECYLCGHSLDTYVEHIPSTRFAVERAQCHNCMTLVRVKNHSIQ